MRISRKLNCCTQICNHFMMSSAYVLLYIWENRWMRYLCIQICHQYMRFTSYVFICWMWNQYIQNAHLVSRVLHLLYMPKMRSLLHRGLYLGFWWYECNLRYDPTLHGSLNGILFYPNQFIIICYPLRVSWNSSIASVWILRFRCLPCFLNVPTLGFSANWLMSVFLVL